MPSTVTQALARYREMRDFKKTAEPRGSARPQRHDPPIFVVQKHAASRLHYDLRLEMEGVLKSWAVPKGPSLDPKQRRLAMATEDHPLEYADFEGSIPEGEYGGGTMIIWDRGTYEVTSGSYRDGRLSFTLHGEKLHGGFALARTGNSDGQWMLFKKRDEHTTARDVLKERPESVLSGLTVEEMRERG